MDAYGENISVVAMSEKPCAYSINHVLAGGTQHADRQTEMVSIICMNLMKFLNLNVISSLLSPSPT
ncbi:hypothetical protein B296_00051002 [Ensete ventricosum]|uniref:Uncharacterized protein n=1 Tax=Ensete ventricosum TaxID=4639 RepID=A0A426Y6N2_ENSVE|nr:hypothetical protein B296_00051002 [Ensete ventricosum]